MAGANRRRLEEIADDILDSFPVFFRRVSRGEARQGSRRFDPSRFVLRAVQKHGPVRMSEIGKHMGVSKPYMTMLVNRLIAEGLVERVQDAHDRRVVNVRITEAGRDAIREFTRGARQAIINNLSSLDPKDISSLHESMKRIRCITSKLERREGRKCKLEKSARRS
ncbi:MAG: MarR family winged helix-turn-helix transcriptional regulator [Thermoplasmata archaeon]